MSAADAAVLVYRLRKVAARTPEEDSDWNLFVDAADALESAQTTITGVTLGFDSLHWGCDNPDHEYGYKKIAAALEAADGGN